MSGWFGLLTGVVLVVEEDRGRRLNLFASEFTDGGREKKTSLTQKEEKKGG